MINIEIVNAWEDATRAHISIRVQETEMHDAESARMLGSTVSGDGPHEIPVWVEYTTSIPLVALAGLSHDQRTSALLDAVKAERALLRNEKTDLGLTGTKVAL